MEAWAFLALVGLGVAIVVWWAKRRGRDAAAAEWAGREFKDWRPRAAQGAEPSSGSLAQESLPTPGPRRVTLNYVLPDADDVADETIECVVAGIDHVGMCGEHRQDTIRRLTAGQELILWRHTDNKHDENAVAIFTLGGKDIGYLPAETAEYIAGILDSKRAVTAKVVGVDEFISTSGSRLLGARLTLTSYRTKRAKTW
jgi:hypothetical protein